MLSHVASVQTEGLRRATGWRRDSDWDFPWNTVAIHEAAGDFKKRTIQLSKRSRTLKTILGNLIAGNQSYLSLFLKMAMKL